MLITCQSCRSEYTKSWNWFVCKDCGFRVCPHCLGSHKGPYSSGGFKCSQCAFGQMEPKSG